MLRVPPDELRHPSGIQEVLDNLERWPKKPHRNERYTLSEQRHFIQTLADSILTATAVITSPRSPVAGPADEGLQVTDAMVEKAAKAVRHELEEVEAVNDYTYSEAGIVQICGDVARAALDAAVGGENA